MRKVQASSDISLGAFNVPPGSVIVTAGGQTLRENVDYTVDYNNGSVKVINQAIINSGVPVNVQYENNASYGTQQQRIHGSAAGLSGKEYGHRILIHLGGTIERLNERPYFTKTNYGEDPIRNTMYGVDVNYRSQWPGLTRLLNKLPCYSSKEMSTITAVGEAAYLKPGHPPQIGKGNSGVLFISMILKDPPVPSIFVFRLPAWALASTPQGNGLFPEASLNDSLPYGYNRAKLPGIILNLPCRTERAAIIPVKDYQNFQDPRISPINIQQLFPTSHTGIRSGTADHFRCGLFSNSEKGPYNFDARPGSVTAGWKTGQSAKALGWYYARHRPDRF